MRAYFSVSNVETQVYQRHQRLSLPVCLVRSQRLTKGKASHSELSLFFILVSLLILVVVLIFMCVLIAAGRLICLGQEGLVGFWTKDNGGDPRDPGNPGAGFADNKNRCSGERGAGAHPKEGSRHRRTGASSGRNPQPHRPRSKEAKTQHSQEASRCFSTGCSLVQFLQVTFLKVKGCRILFENRTVRLKHEAN